MKNPSQVNLTAVGGKPRAHDWLLLVNPPPLMLQFFFPRCFNGNHSLYYEKYIANSICNWIQFRLLLDQSIYLFIYFLKLHVREVFKDWQKFLMKEIAKVVALPSYWMFSTAKWNQNLRILTLNGLIRDWSRKSFQIGCSENAECGVRSLKNKKFKKEIQKKKQKNLKEN